MERTSRRFHLTYPEHLVQEPVVSRLVSEHGLEINIRRADVTAEVGWILLEVTGTHQQIRDGRDYLEQRGVVVRDAGGDVVAG